MVRSFRQGRRRPAALPRLRLQDHRVVKDADLALVALDLDSVRALAGGPGQKDAAHAVGRNKVDTRRVFERLIMEAARLERCCDASGNAGPAGDAIKRMPAVIEQDSAACLGRVDAPVRNALRAHRDRRLGSQRTPADASHGPDGAVVDKSGDLAADRRLQPIVHRVQDPPGSGGGGGDALRVLDPGGQRLFAQHMQARVKRAFDQRGVAARRRADVDEIELFVREQIVDARAPPAIGAGGEKRLAARRRGVGRGDNPHVVAGEPAGQVPLGRDIAEADERAFQHFALLSRARTGARSRRMTDREYQPRATLPLR